MTRHACTAAAVSARPMPLIRLTGGAMAMAVAALVAIPALAIPALAEPAPRSVPHRAHYARTLADATGDSGIAAVTGDMTVIFDRMCKGWSVLQASRMEIDFVEAEQRIDILSYIRQADGIPAVVALRTFSKAFGLAGLRVGFGLMHRDIANLLHRVRQPFNINLPAQAGALAALADDAHYNATINKTRAGRLWLQEEVKKIGCIPYPSQTNFFLIDVRGDATTLYESMLHKGVIIRSMAAYGYPNFIRITVGTKNENERFVTALKESLSTLNYV